MNYLAHLYLAEYTGTSPAGNVLGDSVRGNLAGRFPAPIERGIRLHRAIDSYTDSHPVIRAACGRFRPPLRRYAGICIDIYFDHLLARDWMRWHAHSLQAFAQGAVRTMEREWPREPFTRQRLAGLAEILVSYRHPDSLVRALERVDERASRPTPLVDALPVLRSQDARLRADFEAFFPQLKAFALQRAEVTALR